MERPNSYLVYLLKKCGLCEILLAVKGQIPFRKEKNILVSPQ